MDQFRATPQEAHVHEIHDLVAQGKEKGWLTTDEIADALGGLDLSAEHVDYVYTLLADEEIEVVDHEPGADSKDVEVQTYLKEIGGLPLLTAEQEVDLAMRIEAGLVAEDMIDAKTDFDVDVIRELARRSGLEVEGGEPSTDKATEICRRIIRDGLLAKRKVVEANLRLVVSIAKRYVGRGMPFLDLIQEGNLGLIRAVEKFDYKKGYKFSTYATWWIRQAITRAMGDQARTVPIPVHMVERINKLIRVQRKLLQDLGQEPLAEWMAEQMEMTSDEIEQILKVSQEPISLETPIGETQESRFVDFFVDSEALVALDAASSVLLQEQLEAVLQTANPPGLGSREPGQGSEKGSISTRSDDGDIGPPDGLADTEELPPPRYLQGRLPERVHLGDTVSLLVRVGTAPGPGTSASLRHMEVPSEGLKVLLVIHTTGFNPRSSPQVHLTVPVAGDSDWALFEMQASEPGVHSVEVLAFSEGSFLGSLTIQSTVDLRNATSGWLDRKVAVRARHLEEGECSLLIHYDAAQAVYRYQLIDATLGVPEESRSERLMHTPYQAVEELVAQLNALARGTVPWTASQTQSWLKNKGIELWREFIPDALQRQFFERRDRISRLLILSSGDPVPWELLYPFTPGEQDGGFLIDQFPVARWLYGQAPAPRLPLSRVHFVMPPESPASAVQEIASISAMLGEALEDSLVTGLSELLDLFAGASFGTLHFACHNAFVATAPDSSQVMMGTSPFQPTFLNEHAQRFRDLSPLVFMNACRTDGQAPLYTRLDGWAIRFLAAGAGAFIGTLWEVTDKSASLYAQEFYRTLMSGATLGDAARKGREAIRDRPGDPTWLAYSLYGDPAATLT